MRALSPSPSPNGLTFPSFYQFQPTLSAHNFMPSPPPPTPPPLPYPLNGQSRGNKRYNIEFRLEFELGLPRWELSFTTTNLVIPVMSS